MHPCTHAGTHALPHVRPKRRPYDKSDATCGFPSDHEEPLWAHSSLLTWRKLRSSVKNCSERSVRELSASSRPEHKHRKSRAVQINSPAHFLHLCLLTSATPKSPRTKSFVCLFFLCKMHLCRIDSGLELFLSAFRTEESVLYVFSVKWQATSFMWSVDEQWCSLWRAVFFFSWPRHTLLFRTLTLCERRLCLLRSRSGSGSLRPHGLLHALLLEGSSLVSTPWEGNNDLELLPPVWLWMGGVHAPKRRFRNLLKLDEFPLYTLPQKCSEDLDGNGCLCFK